MKFFSILRQVYEGGEKDATPYVKRFIGLLVCYPVAWLGVSFIRIYRGASWDWSELKHLLHGETILLGFFIVLHLYAISKYGWRRFFQLIREV
jgi:uncharacterized membrane protein